VSKAAASERKGAGAELSVRLVAAAPVSSECEGDEQRNYASGDREQIPTSI